ncbi:hypothetical protein HDU76_002284 [Blyttiomyces sp. JEL0837]|nr:hypothetical protein HDU76_002284 [Blyttiomyces sp. JEL0837]
MNDDNDITPPLTPTTNPNESTSSPPPSVPTSTITNIVMATTSTTLETTTDNESLSSLPQPPSSTISNPSQALPPSSSTNNALLINTIASICKAIIDPSTILNPIKYNRRIETGVMVPKDKRKIVLSESLLTGVVPSKASKIDELLDGDGGNKIFKDGNDNVDDVNVTDLMKDIPNTGKPSNKTTIIQYASKVPGLTQLLNNHHVTPILKATRDLHIPIFSRLVGSIVDIGLNGNDNSDVIDKEIGDSQEVGISNVINKLGRLNLELKGYMHANLKVVGGGGCGDRSALLIETSPSTSSSIACLKMDVGTEDILTSTVDTNQGSMGSDLLLSRRVPVQHTPRLTPIRRNTPMKAFDGGTAPIRAIGRLISTAGDNIMVGSHLTPQETFKRALDEKFRERSGEFWDDGGCGESGVESGIEKLRSRRDRLRRRRKSLESRSPSSQCESVDGECGGCDGGEEDRGRSVGRGDHDTERKVGSGKLSSRWEEDRVWLEGPLKVHGCGRKVSGDQEVVSRVGGGGLGKGDNDDSDVGVAPENVPCAAMV